jgi:hypothetical protein
MVSGVEADGGEERFFLAFAGLLGIDFCRGTA